MGIDEEMVRFERAEPSAVIAAMDELTGEGDGWINVAPALTVDEEMRIPVRTGLAAWFSGRGPHLAMGTWTPSAAGGRSQPAQIGIEHGTGPNALRRLSEMGIALPAGWVKRQDHAKHGIVIELPDDADPEKVITWLLAASTALQSVIEAGDRWTAVVHRRVTSS